MRPLREVQEGAARKLSFPFEGALITRKVNFVYYFECYVLLLYLFLILNFTYFIYKFKR